MDDNFQRSPISLEDRIVIVGESLLWIASVALTSASIAGLIYFACLPPIKL